MTFSVNRCFLPILAACSINGVKLVLCSCVGIPRLISNCPCNIIILISGLTTPIDILCSVTSFKFVTNFIANLTNFHLDNANSLLAALPPSFNNICSCTCNGLSHKDCEIVNGGLNCNESSNVSFITSNLRFFLNNFFIVRVGDENDNEFNEEEDVEKNDPNNDDIDDSFCSRCCFSCRICSLRCSICRFKSAINSSNILQTRIRVKPDLTNACILMIANCRFNWSISSSTI